MRKTITMWMSAAVLICALTLTLFHVALAKPAPALPDKHPDYHQAVDALRDARKHLEKAEADGYGHRDRAMQLIDQAIGECNEAVGSLR